VRGLFEVKHLLFHCGGIRGKGKRGEALRWRGEARRIYLRIGFLGGERDNYGDYGHRFGSF